jgi:endo-1,4-beta-xylanase
MKFTAALVALVSGLAVAAPIEEAAQEITLAKRAPGGMNYVQNYNGGAAGFKNNLNAGTFSLKWGGNTDVVAGIGWSTGSARCVNFETKISLHYD